jgi:hypothetical protein
LTALIARSPLRSSRWCSGLLASCIAAYASSGVCAYTYPDNRDALSAGIVAVDVATPAAACSPAEQASIRGAESGERPRLTTLQSTEASHLAILKPAEGSHLATLDSAEEFRLATLALDDDSHLAAYLRVHYANEQDAVTLYPLAAFAAAARRTGQYSRGSSRGGRCAFARRAGVGAGGRAACVSSVRDARAAG